MDYAIGWLIEGAGPVYWTGRGKDDFSKEHLAAVRFSRQQDAERVLRWMLPVEYARTCKTVEHMWCGNIDRTVSI